MIKVMNKVDGFLYSDEMDKQYLKIIINLLIEKLVLVKFFDKEIIEGCYAEEIVNKIEEFEYINL